MRRRDALKLFIAVLAVPSLSGAQERRAVPRIGIIHPSPPPDPWLDSFQQELRELGYIPGHNIAIDYRSGRGAVLDELARDLLVSRVDILVTTSGPAVLAAKRQTTSVPIVMAMSGDPVGTGVVANIAHPGENVTGLSLMSADLAGLRLGMLKEAVPRARRVGVLFDPTEPPTAQELRETEIAAKTLALTLEPLPASNPDALNQAFAKAAELHVDALITFAHAFAFVNRVQIISLSAQHRLPAMYGWREFAEAGGLMSYGPNVKATFRRAAVYIDRIIKGARPADMPIEQPSTFEFVINQRTAKALGIEFSPALLVHADEVIE
jgi:putative tryptophan/tyrosine transport system substrate-binding protein